MPLLKPFRAWHYHPERVAIDRVVAPPYDVISEPYKQELYKRDPHNAIRLVLGQPKAGGVHEEEKYAAAKQYFNKWSKSGILACEPKESFYLYEMTYAHPFLNKSLSRLAIFALLKLEPFERKIIFPHEKTHSSPKADRGKLLRAAQANFSPIFGLYEDPTLTLDELRKNCEAKKPLFNFSDDQKVKHRLWVVNDKKETNLIASQFDRKRIFIADGHHRYETALNYAHEMRRKTDADTEQSYDYVMSALVRFNDPGLSILPIHRVVLDSGPLDKETFVANLKKYFILHSVSRAVLEKVSEGSLTEGFGLAFSETECYLLELKDNTTARRAMPEGKPEQWYGLDMNLVSFLILEPLLGIDHSKLEWNIFYTPSLNEVFDKFRQGQASCAFIIRPVTPGTIKEICESGELMPQKSTYFYPKFPSGLLMYKH